MAFATAPPTHFLSLHRSSKPLSPRPSTAASTAYDVSTVAAADFDIDVYSGFMPPAEPIARLEGQYEVWEDLLDVATASGSSEGGFRVRLASELVNASQAERDFVSDWRARVRQVGIIYESIRYPLSLERIFMFRRRFLDAGRDAELSIPRRTSSPPSARRSNLPHALLHPFNHPQPLHTHLNPTRNFRSPHRSIPRTRRDAHPHLRRHRPLELEAQ